MGLHPDRLRLPAGDGVRYPLRFFPPKGSVVTETLAENAPYVGTSNKTWSPCVATDAEGHPSPLTGRPLHDRSETPVKTKISCADLVTASPLHEFRARAPAPGSPVQAEKARRSYPFSTGAALYDKHLARSNRDSPYRHDREPIRHDFLDYTAVIEQVAEHPRPVMTITERRGDLEDTLITAPADDGTPSPSVMA